ncbi:hypothetical protein [Candidatus Nitrosacidococcus sp. I8]|uniref:hypothetical protein n=1 Tax=Candidatus Nitrosacidococcus sp. I8 TaxID=2942908 RepID=UPI002227A1CB|nr:hypothetical protein [Candidatus Nitrosacidococcus sp. I8]CAH9014845.1 hypothetical protein NURINAE_00112 [Candidatus Nitrosacidococcus sp. I8]
MKKTKLATALALAVGVGAWQGAQAVNLNPDGSGDALYFPYYTVRTSDSGSAMTTSIVIVNTTNQTKEVKVRFREGKNSWEVLDFDVYLSPQDIWTGALTMSPNGGGMLSTADTSCTVPAIPQGGVEFIPSEFSNLSSSVYFPDGAGEGLDRTTEGYVEILEMGVINDTSDAATGTNASLSSGQQFTPATWAKHNSAGMPNNCQALVNAWTDGNWSTIGNVSGVSEPTGGLMGEANIIDVADAVNYGVNAVAIDHTFQGTGTANHVPLGTDEPNLASAATTSNVFTPGGI